MDSRTNFYLPSNHLDRYKCVAITDGAGAVTWYLEIDLSMECEPGPLGPLKGSIGVIAGVLGLCVLSIPGLVALYLHKRHKELTGVDLTDASKLKEGEHLGEHLTVLDSYFMKQSCEC